jgi:PAS domain S-box-containing protein
MLGYQLEELEGHYNTWEKMVHPDDLVIVSHKLHDHLRGRTEFYEAEYRMKHKAGKWVWILDRGRVTERDDKGKAVRACGTHFDITERKNMEQDLEEKQRQYKAIFEDPMVFVGRTDKQGVLIEANRTALEFIGRKEGDIKGKKFWETPWWTHSPQLQDKLKDAIKKAAEGEYISFEASHIGKNDEEIMVYFTARPVKDENGKVSSLLCNGIDITRRIRDEEKIKHLNRVMKALSSVNQIITRERDPVELINKASDQLIVSGGYKYVWIVLFNDNGVFDHLAGEKVKKEFPEIESTLKKGGLFKCQEKALETKDLVVLKDLPSNCQGCPISKKYRDLKSFCMPMLKNEKIYGTITAALPQEAALSREEEKLFRQLTLDLAYALSNIESEKRAKDLRTEKEEHVHELEVFYDSAIGREERIMQLKEQVQELKKKLENRG